MSPGTSSAFGPSAAASAAARSGERTFTATRAPRERKCSAVARPKPRAAPVMRTTRSEKSLFTLNTGRRRFLPAPLTLHALPGLFWSIHVRCLPEEYFGRFHQRLRERRMRMNGELQIGGRRAHFHRKHTF